MICLLISLLNVPFLQGNKLDSSYFEPWYIIYIFLYVVLFSVYSVKEYKSIKYFGYLLFSCFFLQAIVVFMSVLYAPVRLVILQLFNSGFEDMYEKVVENGSRIMGIGLGFSTGSIICSTCGAYLTYMFLKKQLPFITYLFLYAILVAMTFFIGRTGAILELLFLVFVFVTRPKYFLKYSFVLCLLLLVLIYAISDLISSSDVANGLYYPVFKGRKLAYNYIDVSQAYYISLALDDASNPYGINNTTLPTTFLINNLLPSSYLFILGTGVMQGRLPQGDYMYSDCGYMMLYSALGIIGAIIYYLANLNLYRSVLANVKEYLPRLFMLFLVFTAFIIEYKEPFMQKYVFSYIILTIGLFQIRNVKV